ncbi:MAG: choice-of-anchor J domain-containing protein [Bacteroidota bacterium]
MLKSQPIFEEDFENGIPNTFTLVDNDGLIPNDPLFTNAWIAISDGGFNEAASTSWYNPAGQADDWLITPAINIPASGIHILSWLAYTLEDPPFSDGYEVRVSTTNTDIGSFNDVIFSIAEENTLPTTRRTSLASYAGQTIYIAFRNNSIDKNLLFLDDLEVFEQADFDAALVEVERLNLEYSLLPVKQSSPFNLSVKVANLGNQPLTNISVAGSILDEGGNPLFNDGMGGAVANLAPGDTIDFNGTGSFTPPDTGLFLGVFIVSTAQEDQIQFNDTLVTGILVTDTTYARDIITNQGLGSIGVGTNADGKVLGSVFEYLSADIVSSTTVLLLAEERNLGDQPFVSIYSVNPTTGRPTANVVANSFPYTISQADVDRGENDFFTSVDFTFPDGPISLQPGKYLFGIHEGDSLLSLGETLDIYTPETSFVTENNGQLWESMEEGYNGLQRAIVIRPNMNSCATLKVDVSTTFDAGSGTGSAELTVEGAQLPITYTWSGGQTTASVSGLAAGNYTVTVTDAAGCSVIQNVVIGVSASIDMLQQAGVQSLEIYPVPAKSYLQLDLALNTPSQSKVSLMDLQGRILQQNQFPLTDTVSEILDVSELPTGIYLLEVRTDKGRLILKWMKQN